ncbi:titin-like [Armigeres subalbatus]|uniref:titin-like n=1 Tax=Armigeres subalbatus TaxID=124917 RepID=UPI002ED09A36
MKMIVLFPMVLAIVVGAAVNERRKSKRDLWDDLSQADEVSLEDLPDDHELDNFPKDLESWNPSHRDKEVKHVPVPYLVEVEKKVPVEVKVPFAVPVEIEKKVPVIVEKKVPVIVEKRVPVHIDRPVPYRIKFIQKQYVHVPKPVIVPIPKRVPVFLERPIIVEKTVPLTIHIQERKRKKTTFRFHR